MAEICGQIGQSWWAQVIRATQDLVWEPEQHLSWMPGDSAEVGADQYELLILLALRALPEGQSLRNKSIEHPCFIDETTKSQIGRLIWPVAYGY